MQMPLLLLALPVLFCWLASVVVVCRRL